MAIRTDELASFTGAQVYRFPTAAVRARARRRLIARRVRTALLSAVTIVAFVLAQGGGGAVEASRRPAPRSVVVQPGETLWDLAERYAPPRIDPRAFVDAIEHLNDLEGPLVPGEHLKLPR